MKKDFFKKYRGEIEALPDDQIIENLSEKEELWLDENDAHLYTSEWDIFWVEMDNSGSPYSDRKIGVLI